MSHSSISARRLRRVALATPSGFLAFGLGSGLAPVAPGTFGTIAAVPFAVMLKTLPMGVYLALLIAAFLIGVWLCERVSKRLGVHDHGGIVWDEFVGYWLTVLLVPFTWQWLLAGFVLFRLFDILKPWPIHWLDRRVKGGFGVMLDDIIAALYALLIMLAMQYYFAG